MNKKKPVETPEDLVRALDDLLNQVLEDVPEEVDEILREAGFDPEHLGKEMADFARHVSASSPLDWRNKRADIEQAKSQLRASSTQNQMTRTQKEQLLQQLLLDQDRLDMAVAYRNYKEMSDHDLDSLLADVEYLRERHEKPDGKRGMEE